MNRYSFRNKHLVAFMTLLITLSLSLLAGGQSNATTQAAPGAQQVATTAQQNAPAPQQNTTATATQSNDQQKDKDKDKPLATYSWGALSVIILLFVMLGLLFVLQLHWAHILDQTSYQGKLYKESLEENEFKRIASPCHENFVAGTYQEEVMRDFEWLKANPAPQSLYGSDPRAYFSFNRRPGGNLLPGLPSWEEDRKQTPEERKAAEQKAREYERLMDEWKSKVDAEAGRRYGQDLDRARSRASALASLAINETDLAALRGRGPEFVLGFTTIVAIVFGVVALGVIRVLNPEQIGTLLAAIAGYVLGRTTSRGAATPEQTQKIGEEGLQLKPTPLRKVA